MRFPYNVMRHASWDFAPRDPVSVGSFVLGGIGITGASTFIAGAVGYFVTTAVTSWAMKALAPTPTFSTINSGGILVNGRGAANPQDFVYGQVRKGGTVVYDETTGIDNKYLHRVIALAGHEIEEIGDIYINDEIVQVDANGFVGGKWKNKIRINRHLGDQTTVDADLILESNQIQSTFVGNGIAYIYVRFAYDQDVFANGLPTITAVIKGKKVYDPRTDTTAYSDNAALCLRDYIVSSYGLSDDDVDDVAFQAAANECDIDVPLNAGGTEKKYTMNGIVPASASHGDVLQQMVTCCAGTLFWGMGKWKLVPGAYSAPVKSFTLDDLRGPLTVQPRVNLRDNFNTVRGTFNHSGEDWITVDYPQVTSSVFKDEDGGEELALDLELPFTTSQATAQRLAKLTLYRAREQIAVQADFSLAAFDVQVGDIITFSNERYGWDGKEFEVVGWQLTSGEGGSPRVRLSLRETSEAAFDWNAEETEILANSTSLLSTFDVPTPSLNAAVIGTTVNNDGTTVPQILFSWTTTEAELVDQYDFQWKLSTESDWNSTTTRTTEFVLAPALSGAAYDYRVRAVNGFGVRSPFASSVSPASTGDDGTTPNAPSNLTASGGQGAVQLSWDAPTQNTDGSTVKDLFQYKIYRNASNNFGTASLVGRVAADSFAQSALDDDTTYYYWVTALDYTGNESAESSVASATTLPAAETRGGGTYYINVTALPTTSSGAHTDFTAAIGDPVDYDRAWFYTGTLQSPTAQSVWIYEEGSGATPADSWNEQEEVIDGDLLVAGTITTDKVATNAITTDKIAAGEVGSVQIADDIQSDNYAADTAGWKIDRLNGNAEFNDVLVRGILSATVIDAQEPFLFLSGQNGGADCLAPLGAFDYAASGVSSASNSSSITSALFYGPDASPTGYNAKRVARYGAASFLIEGEFNHYRATGTTTLSLQVSVDGGSYTNIFSTSNLLFGQSATGVQERIVTTYTTPASFNTLRFRAFGAQAGRSYIRVTLDNWL